MAVLYSLDLTALNLSPMLEAPIRQAWIPAADLVYAGSGHEVKTVIVAGKVLVRDGRVLTAGQSAIRAEAQVQAELLAQRVAVDPVHEGMALLEAMGAVRVGR